MNLYRLALQPRSPWRTPWQADTLTGALCATAARVHGPDFLRQRLIEPMLGGHPPFVVSDAFPANFLPLPMYLRLADPPAGVDAKTLKRARWMARSEFLALQSAKGSAGAWERLLPDSAVFLTETSRHNTLSRESDASLEEGGLFSRSDTLLRANGNGDGRLDLYFRARDSESADLLLDLVYELSLVGFGADVATGRGQFDIAGEPQPAGDLDEPRERANGVIVLSSFQPAAGDPTDGCWEAFPKFGKLGPDMAVPDVRKHTLIMFRAGACFHCDAARSFLGRAIPMSELLPDGAVQTLNDRGISVIHPAFGLAMPARADWNIE